MYATLVLLLLLGAWLTWRHGPPAPPAKPAAPTAPVASEAFVCDHCGHEVPQLYGWMNLCRDCVCYRCLHGLGLGGLCVDCIEEEEAETHDV